MQFTKPAFPVSLTAPTLLMFATSALTSCGKTEEDEVVSASRDIPGVVLLDDGEDGNSQTLDDEAGYLGFWYTFDDKHECDNSDPTGETYPTPAPDGGDEFAPTPYPSAAEAPPLKETVAPNTAGLRIRGGGHNLWGAGLGIAFYNPAGTPLPYDLAAQGFTGIRFWAKNTGPTPITLGIQISDDFSEPNGGQCVPRDEVSCSLQGCFDSALYEIANVGSEWQLHEVLFSQLARGSWGVHNEDVTEVPTGPNLTKAYQLQFKIDNLKANVQPNEFDVWIDNVGLILGG